MINLRIVKVGGSLLQQEDLPHNLRTWLDNQPPLNTVLIAGGGSMVDAIRDADRRFELDQNAAHWLAIRAMQVTARLLAELLSCPVITKIDEQHVTPFSVLDTWDFLQDDAKSNTALPASWEVTSDSIAAKVAISVGAELVLAKSRSVVTVEEAIEQGVVDRYFRSLVESIPAIRIVNLKSQKARPEP